MNKLDETTSLFEHIRDRLPVGYGLGDDGAELIDDVYNHKTFQQSLRENHEGDVGIAEINGTVKEIYKGVFCNESTIQITVVTVNGDIDNAMNYLRQAFENINSNKESTGVFIGKCKLVSIYPLGKNSSGFHMCNMNLLVEYVFNK